MLRHFGSRQVAILDGGLGKWMAEDRAVENAEPTARHARYEAIERPNEVVLMADIQSGIGETLLDARGQARFEGIEPDPRPGVAPGHIPGSRNLPYGTLYNEDGTFRSREEITRIFAAAGVNPQALVRRQLRIGSHRQLADLRRAFARQRGNPALRWQLERVGRRSLDAKGERTRLAQHQARDVLEAEANFVGDLLSRGVIGPPACDLLG